jgi:hypothetical protein
VENGKLAVKTDDDGGLKRAKECVKYEIITITERPKAARWILRCALSAARVLVGVARARRIVFYPLRHSGSPMNNITVMRDKPWMLGREAPTNTHTHTHVVHSLCLPRCMSRTRAEKPRVHLLGR